MIPAVALNAQITRAVARARAFSDTVGSKFVTDAQIIESIHAARRDLADELLRLSEGPALDTYMDQYAALYILSRMDCDRASVRDRLRDATARLTARLTVAKT